MPKPLSQIFSRFDGGMVSDPRSDEVGVAQLIKNLDAYSFSRKLVPFRESESGDDAASTSKKENFALAIRTGVTYSVYALGVKSGTSFAEVLYKNLTTGGTNDLSDNTWANTGNHQASANGAVNLNLFVYYPYTTVANSRIFGASGG
mgnify:FL=1